MLPLNAVATEYPQHTLTVTPTLQHLQWYMIMVQGSRFKCVVSFVLLDFAIHILALGHWLKSSINNILIYITLKPQLHKHLVIVLKTNK